MPVELHDSATDSRLTDKPRGTFGRAYRAFIKPFRYAIIYPALMRYLDRLWSERRGSR